MPGNLRDRLQRIQQIKVHTEKAEPGHIAGSPELLTEQGWDPCGYMTMRRITGCEPVVFPKTMPAQTGMIIPGINDTDMYTDLLFFDLETTGLSTGAGTMAFLAAFGRLTAGGPAGGAAGGKAGVYRLSVTQYLLLDYPGESDFITMLLDEINRANSIIVSYNGKCFDSHILKTRCLMNGFSPPEYRHADLLHPARRLWKRLLSGCSQAAIETGILGIDRTGDTPGFMAPDIWFNFLKNGDALALLGICDHNRRDIFGLASIFAVMTVIADDPLKALNKYDFDFESLSFRRALTLRREGKYTEAGKWLLQAVQRQSPVQILALRTLAIDSEHRLKSPAEALQFTEQCLQLLPKDSLLLYEFNHRAERLRRKIKQ